MNPSLNENLIKSLSMFESLTPLGKEMIFFYLLGLSGIDSENKYDLLFAELEKWQRLNKNRGERERQ